MKEQIQEMAKDLCQAEFWDVDEDCCDLELDRRKTAENLYNAGYRKQIEGEWETETTNWVYDVKRTYCSNCRKSAIFDSFMGKYHLTNYCPNCGAKMKGGAE